MLISEKWQKRFFTPWVTIVISLVLGALFSWAVILFLSEKRVIYIFYYFFPVFVVFFMFLFDRFQFTKQYNWFSGVIDGITIFLSILRAFYAGPLFSGHALFLTFSLLTVRRKSTRVIAGLVWLEVLYIKLFVWHDDTFYGGLLFGIAAAFLWFFVNRVDQKSIKP